MTSQCFVPLGFYTMSLLSLYKHKLIFKKSPNLNNKLQSEVLIILFIQQVPLFHFLPKNRGGSISLFEEKEVCELVLPASDGKTRGWVSLHPEHSQDTHDAQASAPHVPKLSGMGVCVGWPVRQLGPQRW